MDLLVIITFSAVLVALFGQKFWDWWNRPKIKFSLKNEEPHIVWDYSHGLIKKLFRIKIINKGNTVAKNCYVKVLSVFPSPKEKLFEPDALKWSSSPKDTRYVSDLYKEPIYRERKDLTPNGGWEFCDLFSCLMGDDRITFSSSGIREFLAWEKTYFVTIEIYGENIKPKIATLKISYFHDTFKTRIDWA